jgi:lysozyme
MPRAALRLLAARLALAMLAGFALSASLPAAQPARAADQNVAGIDVSHYQGDIRWADMASSGDVGFVIAKATEGRLNQDAQYARNKAKADEFGVPFTAYHFASPDTTANDAILEADNFVDTADLGPGNLRPVLDLEKNGGLGVKKLRRWVKAWIAEVELRVGAKPIIYSSPSFWHDKMGNSRWFANNGYALWIAHWGVAKPRVPASNWSGHGWTIWQYDNCGHVAGIDGCVDLDRLKGSDIDALRIPPAG